MATFESSIKYGLGLEDDAAGTEAATYIGIPQESLVKIPYGQQREHVKRFRGTARKIHREDIVTKIQDSRPSGFSHNFCFETFVRLMAAMHQTAGSDSANVFTLTCPSAGATVTEGDAAWNNGSPGNARALSVKQDFGARHAALGCVPTRIQLTFPADGGPVKMSYDFVAMNATDAAANDTMTIESTNIDLITSDFAFYLNQVSEAETTQIYPGGDIVVTFEPRVEALPRGADHNRQICIDEWGGSFEYRAVADSDPEELHDFWKSGARKALVIVYGDGTESSNGEFTLQLNGDIIEEPGQESAPILQESAKFELTTKDTTDTEPYKFTYFSTEMPEDV